jgi:hypothetical protein
MESDPAALDSVPLMSALVLPYDRRQANGCLAAQERHRHQALARRSKYAARKGAADDRAQAGWIGHPRSNFVRL